jgi:RimJ/RimL family protein N-acetyltransferase
MTMRITFTLLADSDVSDLERWHEDPELRRRYGGDGWPTKLLKIMRGDPNRHCFIAWEGSRKVGYVDFEIIPKENLGHIGLIVDPLLRGSGYGKQILRAVLNLPEISSVTEVRAGIEKDNIASIRCFLGVGFRQLDELPDHEGCLNFSITM